MASPYPSVDALVREASCAAPHALVVRAARHEIAERRARGEPASAAELAPAVRARVAAELEPALRRVLNATGVVLHTNLGRAPLADEAIAAVVATAGASSNIELDLETGRRGSRQAHLAPLLCELLGCEDALCVNNGAAAILLALAALARGREVIVSRGQLVEIGDGFRIPDVLAQSGARLVEVGTTNRTRRVDYERAIGPETAAVLWVHPSNYRVLGFAGSTSLGELRTLCDEHELPLLADLGSGSLLAHETLHDEPTAQDVLTGGVDLVTFSGDKLLGGPQAGILAGRGPAIEACRRHPLARAMRIDRLSVAALEATLRLYRDPAVALAQIPTLRTLLEPTDRVRARAERLAARIGGTVVATTGRVGGGALPLAELESYAVSLPGDPDARCTALRAGDPPVIARISDGACLLDCRTLSDREADEVPALPR
jgi:L-seryl-tRNA(Ser) seleniumtransferase